MKNNKTTTTIVVFNKKDYDVSLIGFFVAPPKEAATIMKYIRLLCDNNSSFYIDGFGDIVYSIDDFYLQKLSAAEFETVSKLFDIDIDERGKYGIFPDPANDVFEEGLVEDI